MDFISLLDHKSYKSETIEFVIQLFFLYLCFW